MYCFFNSHIKQEGIELLTDVRVSFMPLVDTEGYLIMSVGKQVLGVMGKFKAGTRYGLNKVLPNILHPTEFIPTPTVSIPLRYPAIEVRARLGKIGPKTSIVPTIRDERRTPEVLEAIQVRYTGTDLRIERKYR